ncbi:MAG: Asp23/Gls24 family envelope stress response protein [Lentisphaerae bacterium]|nr:Asp23/Gls24 family envelope stress response protein [Lentisphaerota bacterium]
MNDPAGNAVTELHEIEHTGSEYGTIRIENSVLAVIAHEAAKKVVGVAEIQGGFADGLAGIIGKKAKDRGIRIGAEEEDFRSIDLAIVVEFGVCIPDVCLQLQAAVKRAVEDMTGQPISAVNVVVQGIRSAEPKTEEE